MFKNVTNSVKQFKVSLSFSSEYSCFHNLLFVITLKNLTQSPHTHNMSNK